MSYELHREEFEFGIVGRVVADDEPLNPRLEYDNVTTMACAHSRYTLGDKCAYDPTDENFLTRLVQDIDPSFDDTCPHCSGSGYADDTQEEECKHCEGYGTISLEERAEKVRELYYIQPLYLYDHSGISISSGGFSCHWDSGQVGVQYVSKAKAHKEWGTHKAELVSEGYTDEQGVYHHAQYKRGRPLTDEDYYKNMGTEVEEYDDYLTGNCWGFIVEDESGEERDSCWGFLGDSDYCIETMRSSAKYLVNAKRKEIEAEAQYELRERAEREYWEMRGMMTREN